MARVCQDAFRLAGAVQETDMLRGQGADFLKGVAFWRIFSGLLRLFCVTDAALLMTWPNFFVAGAVL